MSRAVAVNVGANTNEPGFRGPVYPDGSFAYLPIPETEPTRDPVPTYADLALDLPFDLPADVADRPVHLDPEFAEYPCCARYTYGDPWGVKARPLAELREGDVALFYATLTPHGDGHPAWVPPEWGAFLVGEFRLACDPLTPGEERALTDAQRTQFATNPHLKRDRFDAAVLLAGDPDRSGLYDRAVPLSGARGVDANRLVTDLSADSGKGPWWRRPLRYDEAGHRALRDVLDAWPDSPGAGNL